MNPGIYKGIFATYDVPSSCIYKELSHTGRNAGKTVQYWHVWADGDAFPPCFKEEVLQKDKIYLLDKIFNKNKDKYP